jgi:uncharacterized protein YcbK (DUF882 family)
VTVNFARRILAPKIPVPTASRCGLAALLILFGCESLQNATAEGDTRTLSFHHIHTNEDITVTYKVNGRYDEEALKKINWVMRDWRKDEPIKMDPHAIDVLWEVHREVGATEPIWIICGYRSPATNSMLRRRSSGVAQFSQHTLGKAIDFYIPGVPLEELRAAGLRAERGGVGFYPSSNFVHLDTGSVRHWPRMPEAQLARVMSKGPLTRFAGNDRPTRTAAAKLPNPVQSLTRLIGGGRDEAEDAETAATTTATAGNRAPTMLPRPAPARPTQVAAVEPKIEKPADKPALLAAVPMPPSKPAAKVASTPASYQVASAESRPVLLPPRPIQTASLAAKTSLADKPAISPTDIINERGFWHGMPDQIDTPASNIHSGAAARRPGADPVATGSLAPWPMPERLASNVLAYAPTTVPAAIARPTPANLGSARVAPTLPPDTTVAVKRSGDRPSVVASSAPTAAAIAGNVKPGQSFNDPWLRAMILSPSAQAFMSTSLLGAADYRNLGGYLQKPTASVMMTFSDDPHLGMIPERFNGHAVVFVSTVTFHQRTASLLP